MTNAFLSHVAAAFYTVGSIAYVVYIWQLRESWKTVGFASILAGLVAQILAFGWRFSELGYLPIAGLHEAVSFFLWCVLAVFALFHTRYNVAILGSFLSPLALAFLILASSAPKHAVEVKMPEGPLFPIHVLFSFLGESVFAIACVSAVMYLIQERQLKQKTFGQLYRRIPSLSVIENMNVQCLALGFGLLTVGVGTGLVMAYKEWGTDWHWDPKFVLSSAIWALLALALLARRLQGWNGRRSALLMLFTFSVVLFTFIGVNYLSSKHRFG